VVRDGADAGHPLGGLDGDILLPEARDPALERHDAGVLADLELRFVERRLPGELLEHVLGKLRVRLHRPFSIEQAALCRRRIGRASGRAGARGGTPTNMDRPAASVSREGA
jgi:hypothetical protein